MAGGILRSGATVALLGVLAGGFLALALAPLLEGMLFGVRSRDPVTLGGVIALLFAVSLTASYVLALRASRVDPTRVLREE